MIRTVAQRALAPHTGDLLRVSICCSKRPPRRARNPQPGVPAASATVSSRQHSSARARAAVTAAAAAAPGAAAAANGGLEIMPTQRQPGEWESPITSELITSAVRVRAGRQGPHAAAVATSAAAVLFVLFPPRIYCKRCKLPPTTADQEAGGRELCSQRRPLLAGGAAGGEGAPGAGAQVGVPCRRRLGKPLPRTWRVACGQAIEKHPPPAATCRPAAGGAAADVTPPPDSGLNVRTRVQEYGGGECCLGAGAAVFSNFA